MAEEFGAGRSRRGEDRRAALERSLRAHPAGRALRGPVVAPVSPAARAVAPHPAPLRLTARGRRLAGALALAAGVGAAALVGDLVHGSGGNGLHLAGQSSVVVHAGDTLWSIATSVAGDDDVRGVVDRIREVNGLHGSDLVPGQVLVLP
jgi:nucleoid-associated protein YgaU